MSFITRARSSWKPASRRRQVGRGAGTREFGVGHVDPRPRGASSSRRGVNPEGPKTELIRAGRGHARGVDRRVDGLHCPPASLLTGHLRSQRPSTVETRAFKGERRPLRQGQSADSNKCNDCLDRGRKGSRSRFYPFRKRLKYTFFLKVGRRFRL